MQETGKHHQRPAGREAPELSETLEDYLEIVHRLSQRRPAVRVRDIARAKGVRMPTVTAALQRLSKRGLVDYQAREFVVLSAAGASIARRVNGRHLFLSRFLRRFLGVPAAVAERDACGLEHHLSGASLERLAAFVEYVETCPEVGPEFLQRFAECFNQPSAVPCPQSDSADPPPGFLERGPRHLVMLPNLAEGGAGEVARLTGSADFRRRLQRRGLLPGAMIRRLAPARPQDPVRILAQGAELVLDREDAANVYVEPLTPEREVLDGRR